MVSLLVLAVALGGPLPAQAGAETAVGPASSPAVPNKGDGAAGYWMAEAAGRVHAFGAAELHGGGTAEAVAAIYAGPHGSYYLLASSGVVHARGAAHHGNLDRALLRLGESVEALAALPDGSGYWIFTDLGRAFAFGEAEHHGDMGGVALNGPVIAATSTPSGNGYWMVASDGGIFSFGDARFYGSMGGQRLNEPVVGVAPDPDGAGYWLVAADGGIFAFDAEFKGSVPGVLQPGQRLNAPVIGAIAYGEGYLLVASDGGIFTFSTSPFLGSLGSNPPPTPIIGVAATTSGDPSLNDLAHPEDTHLLEADDIASVDDGGTVRTRGVDVSVGDVIVAGVTPATPAGILAAVEAVRAEPGGIKRLETRPALLSEVVPNGQFSVGLPLSTSQLAPTDAPLEPQGLFDGLHKRMQDLPVDCEGKPVLVDVDLSFRGDLGLSAKWNWRGLEHLQFGGTIGVKGELATGLSGEYSCTGTFAMPLDFYFAPITVPVGTVPLILVPHVATSLLVEVSIKGGVELRTMVDAELTLGIRHGPDGLDPYFEPELTYEQPSIQMRAEGEIRLDLRPNIELRAYGIAGPYVEAGPFARLKANYADCDGLAWEASGGLGARAGLRLDLWLLRLDQYFDLHPLEAVFANGVDPLWKNPTCTDPDAGVDPPDPVDPPASPSPDGWPLDGGTNQGPPVLYAYLGAEFTFPDWVSCTDAVDVCIVGAGAEVRVYLMEGIRRVASIPLSTPNPAAALRELGVTEQQIVELLD